MRILHLLAVCCFCTVVSCAPAIPAKKEMSLLTAGTPRARLIQEFGSPTGTYTDRDTGALHDVFRFRQGYSRGKQWAILAGNVAAFSTVGVAYFPQGESMAINVEYDEHERVIRYRPVQ